MTEVLQSPSHFPSPSSSSSSPCANNDPHHHHQQQQHSFIQEEEDGDEEVRERIIRKERDKNNSRERERDQLSLLALLVAAFRKSLIGCNLVDTAAVSCGGGGSKELRASMEIGVPTDVRHVAHVTFDRFDGFLGLPVEFEPEVPRRAPSASTRVFGVSTESMQLSFDSRGNSVPTILLLMQRHLYARGGLKAEGIFRINADNGQEEYVRDQLNCGIVPEGVDVHCLAGLIKAWFRELPTGVLDSLSPEQVMQSQSEEDCAQLVRLIPPMEAALLDWAINLMADVAQMEHLNKMNARNVAVVFAPNMTKMADPLTALMYAVQVMNFLRTLIEKTLREREDSAVEPLPPPILGPPDDSGPHGPSHSLHDRESNNDKHEEEEEEQARIQEEPALDSTPQSPKSDLTTESGSQNYLISTENIIPCWSHPQVDKCSCEVMSQVNYLRSEVQDLCSPEPSGSTPKNTYRSKSEQLVDSSPKKGLRKAKDLQVVIQATEKGVGAKTNILGRLNSRAELTEAWR
ncbi:rho GTPase-activating protein 5-like [Punica granatum]|uniref:Rho GTPase-activating protein 5-like n=1 Tax=Punica granatum TaxID=22663 RepID=A0A218XCV4_PUNGR|nr:rho GTPase-activating protein 5-like [Punica granatum]OWM82536.1 hypothetical protein CDL15_Pgr002111 [Punica granatum]